MGIKRIIILKEKGPVGMEGAIQASESSPTPQKDDSLADFKSPKLERVPSLSNKVKIINEKRVKKSSSSGKTSSSSRKKDGSKVCRRVNNDKVQPSIESSFFKAINLPNKEGHTCPLCMKYFSDATTGTAHTKNCAAKHNVSTKKLLAAVALQERQNDERLAIGLPPGPFVQQKAKIPRKKREPVSESDPELQLALALSESLQENEAEKEFEEALFLAAEHQGKESGIEMSASQRRRTLKNFGFSTNKPATPAITEGPVKSRRRKHLGPTILQTRTKESRDRLLTDRIAEILMGNEAITQFSPKTRPVEIERPKSVLKSRLLNELHRTTMRLWDRAQLLTETTNFYVQDLGPVVVPTDHQQEDCAGKIAKHEDIAIKPNEEDASNKSKNGSPKLDEKIRPETSNRPESNVVETTKNPSIEMRTIHVTDRQYRNALPGDWANILNVSSVSDVVIIVKGTHIWAHKLVFHVRCSDILLDCEPNEDLKFAHVKEQIRWEDVDYLIGLAFLEFVYSGLIEKYSYIFDDNSMVAGVRRLARKYRTKDLFDYIRKRKAELSRLDDIEPRREGLSSPIVVVANEIESEMENRRECNNEDIHTENNIVQDNHITSDSIAENPILDNEFIENHAKNCNEDIYNEKIDDDVEIIMSDIVPDSRSHRAETMSPDLFAETINESKQSEEDLKSPEKSSEGTNEVLAENNSNLRELARLIADDYSESEQSSQEFSPSTSIKKKSENKTPEMCSIVGIIEDCTRNQSDEDIAVLLDDEDENDIPKNVKRNENEDPKSNEQTCNNKIFSQILVKTHKSFDVTTPTPKHHKLSRSQTWPEKQKSNLSLFIEKVKSINSKPAMDSYTDDELLEGAIDRRRFRNPFNVNNASNRSIENFLPESKTQSPEYSDQSCRDKDSQLEKKSSNNQDDGSSDESTEVNEDSPTRRKQDDELSNTDYTSCTDEEDVSMYSKYKKHNKHNNSIVDYRNMLKKMSRKSEETVNDDKNGNEISTNDIAIDLTQESDDDTPVSRSSSVRPCISRKSNNRILDTDSSDISPTKINRETKSTTLIEPDDPNAFGNNMQNVDSCTSRNSSPIPKRKAVRKKSHSISSSDENLEESVKQVNGDPKDGSSFPDSDVFEIVEEMFSQKHSNVTPPKTLSSTSNGSSRAVKRSVSPQSNTLEVDDKRKDRLSDKKQKINDYSTSETSDGRKSPRNYLDHSDLDVIEVNEEISTPSPKNSQNSPSVSFPSSLHFDSSWTSKSSEDKNKCGKPRWGAISLNDSDVEEKRTESLEKLSRRRISPNSSPEYPYFNSVINTARASPQNVNQLDDSSRSTLISSPYQELDSPSKSRSQKNKRCPENNQEVEAELSEIVEHYDKWEQINRISAEANNPQIVHDRSESDSSDRINEVFTQSLKNPDESRTALAALSSLETLRVPSPILLSSSPELDNNFLELVADNRSDFDKENAVESPRSRIDSRQNWEDFDDRYPPFCFDDLSSPQPTTSRQKLPACTGPDSSDSVRKLKSRSISMPENTSNNDNNRKKSRTPKKSSRLTLSQQITPPRNYDEMNTPELKKELEKYGMKPQKRKRARQLLNHIYNEMHATVRNVDSKRNAENNVIRESDDEQQPPSKKIGKINNPSTNDSDSDRDMPLSSESFTSETSVLPEEMAFPDADIPTKETTGSTNIKEAFIALINADKKLYTKVLTYEPLPFEILYFTLKEQGLKCKQSDLMNFLDEECITFQLLAQMGKSRTRKVKGRTEVKRKDKTKTTDKS